MFRKDIIDLIIIESRGGLAKTHLVKHMIKRKDFVYLNVHSTPLHSYVDMYKKRGKGIVYDDIDSLLKNSIMVSFLKALADTTEYKEIHYNSTTSRLGGIPTSFKTKSNVMILCNQFNSKDPIVRSLADRGFYIQFKPSNKEILRYIKKNMVKSQFDSRILDFLKKHSKNIKNFSLRHFVKAQQLYKYDQNKWEERMFYELEFNEKLIRMNQLMKEYGDDLERIKHWGWARSTYYEYKKMFEKRHMSESPINLKK